MLYNMYNAHTIAALPYYPSSITIIVIYSHIGAERENEKQLSRPTVQESTIHYYKNTLNNL